jgi:hypothetical protein
MTHQNESELCRIHAVPGYWAGEAPWMANVGYAP